MNSKFTEENLITPCHPRMKVAITGDATWMSSDMIQEGHFTSAAFFPKPQRDHEKTPLGEPSWGLPHPDVKPNKGITRKWQTLGSFTDINTLNLTICKER